MNLRARAVSQLPTHLNVPLCAIAVLWLLGTAAILNASPAEDVLVVHWANGHMMDSPSLLPAFAKAFNAQNLETESGKQIRIKVYRANSGEIYGEIKTGRAT